MPMNRMNLLIVDDDDTIVRIFERVSRDRNWSYAVARSGEEALERLSSGIFEAAVVDIKLPGFTGLQLLDHVKANHLGTEIVIMTGGRLRGDSVQAMKKGAYDYFTKPFDDINRVVIVLEKAMERFSLVNKIRSLERRGSDSSYFEEMVGKSRSMHEIFDIIHSIAPSDSAVLIQGESGTGKELVAHAIHFRSKRKDMPFVVINCAAIPGHLLESELFGHIKGSFTGAIADKPGLLKTAEGGTVFLDEIGEMPPMLQVKLLRFLQEGEIRPVGANDAEHVDVRLIVATNRDLGRAVQEGGFREDLYYRINVIGIHMPPLRDRRDDIPLLAYHFLDKYAKRMKKTVKRISVDALHALQSYSWVGNVRELENVIERAVVLATDESITTQDLPHKILGEAFYAQNDFGTSSDLYQLAYKEAKNKALESFNRGYIASVLKKAGGNISFAADKAKMDRSNFKKLIKKYSIVVEEYKEEFNKK